MDKGKAKMSLDEMEVLRQSKKQKYDVSEDTLLFGGMSATQTNLDTPSLRTPNFPARSSLTPFSETPMLSINQGQERSFPGLNPTRRVLARRRRRENERQRECPPRDLEPIQLFVDDPSSPQGVLTHLPVTHMESSLGLPLSETPDAALDLSLQDRSWDKFVTPPVEEPMSNVWLGCRRWPPEKMVHKYFENHGFYSNALVEEGIIIRLRMRKYGIEPPFPY